MSDVTADTIFGEILPKKLASNPEATKANAIYVFTIGDDRSWTVDLTKDADFVTSGASEDAQCTITMSEDDFLGLWNGTLPGAQAFMMGKLKIDGDMGLAMKLQSFLGA